MSTYFQYYKCIIYIIIIKKIWIKIKSARKSQIWIWWIYNRNEKRENALRLTLVTINVKRVKFNQKGNWNYIKTTWYVLLNEKSST